MKIQQLGNDVCSHLSIRRINNGVKLQTDDIVYALTLLALLIVGWNVITP